MSKRYNHLWPQVTSFQNLWQAFKKAAKGKRSKPSVAAFEYHLEGNLLELQTELRANAYQPGPYDSFYIHDPKKRLISAAPFRDRVVHHALIRVIEPLFERKFIYDTYANRVGKGTHKALDRCTQYMRKYLYVLPMDVRQFFPSIDHAILMNTIRQTIADERILHLCSQIIESGRGVHGDTYEITYFPGDDLFAPLRPRGLPIGNLTSQFWANVYLNGFDHFVKRQLKGGGYVRYVDDVRLFADTKEELHHWRAEIIHYLAGLRLTLHENSAQPQPCASGVPFLGFQVFHTHRRLKRRNAVQVRRRIKNLLRQYEQGDIESPHITASVQSWVNHVRFGDTWGLRNASLTKVRLPPPLIPA